MYGLKQVYKLDKNLPFFKCKDLMNNAKFIAVINSTENTGTIFTTLRRNPARKELDKFLEHLKNATQGIRQGNYFIILDNI
mgnify:CR=1 FL=1